MDNQINFKSFSKKVLEWYVYGSFHVAIVTGFYISFGYLHTKLPIDWPFVLFISLGTHVIYSFHRVVALDRLENYQGERFKIAVNYKTHIIVYALISLGCMGVFSRQLSKQQMLLIVLPGIISLLYILPILPRRKRLRDFPFLKIFLIAGCYSFLCTYIPLSSLKNPDQCLMFTISSMFFVLALTLSFDIRDIEIDTKENVPTMASSLGPKNTIYLGVGFLVLSLMLFLAGSNLSKINAQMEDFAFATTCLISLGFILKSNKKSEYYYAFWMDGLLALPMIITLTLRNVI